MTVELARVAAVLFEMDGTLVDSDNHDLSDVVVAPGALVLLSLLYRFGLPWTVVTSADRRLAAAPKKVPAELQVDDLLEVAQLLAETFTAT
jgi:phosphoglycolate phosphatase-like HAD superfamily hydrolase